MNLFKLFKDVIYPNEKIWPCGYSINQVKEILQTQTHCGIYWHIKAKYKNNIVSIIMIGNECLFYNLISGLGYRTDEDSCGCGDSNDFDFRIGLSKNKGKLVILKRK